LKTHYEEVKEVEEVVDWFAKMGEPQSTTKPSFSMVLKRQLRKTLHINA